MKVKFSTVIILGLSVIFISCDDISTRITPSAEVSTQEYSINSFSTLNVSNAFDVYIEFSDTEESLHIEVNENLQQYVDVYNSRDELYIKLRDNIKIKNGRATLRAFIKTNDISNFDVSGASSVKLENTWLAGNCSVELSGASNFNGEISANYLSADISGASEINIGGKLKEANIDLSGASDLKDYDLDIDYLDIDLSGASHAQISVSKELRVDGSGASSLYFRGGAAIEKQNLSGASTVRRKD